MSNMLALAKRHSPGQSPIAALGPSPNLPSRVISDTSSPVTMHHSLKRKLPEDLPGAPLPEGVRATKRRAMEELENMTAMVGRDEALSVSTPNVFYPMPLFSGHQVSMCLCFIALFSMLKSFHASLVYHKYAIQMISDL